MIEIYGGGFDKDIKSFLALTQFTETSTHMLYIISQAIETYRKI